MSQSRKGSLIEAVSNIVIGYIIAVMAQMIIFPVFDVHIPHSQHLLMGLLFTVVSLVRSYTLRRLFNLLNTKDIKWLN